MGEKKIVWIDSMDKKLNFKIMIGTISVLYHLIIYSRAG